MSRYQVSWNQLERRPFSKRTVVGVALSLIRYSTNLAYPPKPTMRFFLLNELYLRNFWSLLSACLPAQSRNSHHFLEPDLSLLVVVYPTSSTQNFLLGSACTKSHEISILALLRDRLRIAIVRVASTASRNRRLEIEIDQTAM